MAGRLVNKAIVLALIVSLAIPAQAWSEKAAKSLPHERSKWGGQATEPPVVLAGTAFDAGNSRGVTQSYCGRAREACSNEGDRKHGFVRRGVGSCS